jgi:hypothetical protein
MRRKFKAGTTSLTLSIVVYDTTSTTGAGLAGLTHTTSGLILEYRRAGQSTWTQLGVSTGLVSKNLGDYVSGGICANGDRVGRYEIGIPDAAIAAGVRMVEICLRGAANMHPVDIEIELDAVDYQDAAAFGLSRIDQTIGSRSTLTAGGVRTELATELGRIDATIGSRATQTSVDTIDDFIDTEVVAIKTKTDLIVAFPTNFSNLGITVGGAIAELGPSALAANDLYTPIAQTVWGQLTTTTWATDSFGKHILISNNNNRSVQVTGAGSGHIAADIHALQAGVITSTAFSANWLTAAGLAADAATEIATAVAGIQVLSRLDSMIESDGSGQFRFDTIALSMGAGGAGGGTDWNANERTAFRTILGFNSAGDILDPSSGILDTIRDSITGNQTINVYPVSASTPERVAGTTITYYRNEIRSVSVVTDFTLTNLTLSLTIEDAEGTDLLTIPNGSISRSNQTFTVSIGTSVTSSVGNKRWALRDITGGTNSVIARGVFSVQEAASA